MPTNDRIRVKFLSRIRLPDRNIGDTFLRRFAGRSGADGRCDFLFDPAERCYDWLVVYDDLSRSAPVEPLACAPEHTLLLTGEPSSISVYGRPFLRQFGHVLTSQEPWALQHPRVIRRQAGLLWYYGGADERGTLDALAQAAPPAKPKILSTVCSTKAMRHTLHAKRLEFTLWLKNQLPELDVFGHGMARIENKADALDPYRFHLAIENHTCDHHWTEKLADAYLGHCLPLYFGCTNLDAYFPRESYVWIDIRDPAGALATIERLLRTPGEYERRLPAIIEARRRVLHDYATFPQLARLIEERHSLLAHAAKTDAHVIRGRRAARTAVSALQDLWEKFRRKVLPRPGR